MTCIYDPSKSIGLRETFSEMRDAPPPDVLPFLQRDIVQLYERKAVFRPLTAAPADASHRLANLSVRPARPRSAALARGDAEQQAARSTLYAGFAFPPGSKPSDKAKSPRHRQPLTVVEAAVGYPELPLVSGLNISSRPSHELGHEVTPTPSATPTRSAVMPRPAQTFAPADVDGDLLPPEIRIPGDEDVDVAVGGGTGRPRSASPTALTSTRTLRGVRDFASVEAVNEAVDERTKVLTKLFQERLAQQLAMLQGMREAESHAHEKEVRLLKQMFEARLHEAIERVLCAWALHLQSRRDCL